MCQFCKEPIPKGELEVHIEESHAKIACSRCGVQVEKMHLEDHEVSGDTPCPQHRGLKLCFLSDFRPREEYYVLLNDKSLTIYRFGKKCSNRV